MDRDTWRLLHDDVKRAGESREARIAIVDAWTAYITDKENEVERLRAALDEIEVGDYPNDRTAVLRQRLHEIDRVLHRARRALNKEGE